jgi:hypothetical protein
MLALLIAAAPVTTAVGAERAFAADAQRMGQWTAFAKWADPTAVMYNPQAVWAQDFLKGRKNPPQSVRWWPARSWTSCDRRTAVNTGPWRSAQGSGYFTTLWMRQKSGNWRWTVDGGDTLKTPLAVPRQPAVRRASCLNPRLRAGQIAAEYAKPINRAVPPGDTGFQRSADGTLLYQWQVQADGARQTRVKLWTGRTFATVLDQKVAAPPAKVPAKP